MLFTALLRLNLPRSLYLTLILIGKMLYLYDAELTHHIEKT